MLIHVAISEVKINQRKRSINSQKVQELAKSISEIGLLNPISITSERVLIAGLHRLEAYKILGKSVTIPAMVVDYEDALTLELAEIDENLIRNELVELEQSLHLARRKEIYEIKHPETKAGVAGALVSNRTRHGVSATNDTMSFVADTSAKTGKSERTIERKVKIGDALAPHAERLLDTPVANNQKDLLTIAKMEDEERDAVVEKLATGEAKTVKDAKRQIQKEEQLSVPEDLPSVSERYILIHGDFTLIQDIAPNSIDVIITDPPYTKGVVETCESLARCAADWLKPGGSLIVMIGQFELPSVLWKMNQWINYQWTLAYLTPGGQSPQIFPRKVNTFWKPVLWFVKGEYKGHWIGDVTKSDVNDNDKRFHHWGQSESGMADIMERFSKPGDLVVDPCLGGGTTGIVAVEMNRRFIGIDKDENAIRQSLARLSKLS